MIKNEKSCSFVAVNEPGADAVTAVKLAVVALIVPAFLTKFFLKYTPNSPEPSAAST